MAGKAGPKPKEAPTFPPPPPRGFDARSANPKDLARYGLPQRPDPRTQPAEAALWERCAHRYRDFEHLEPRLITAKKPAKPLAAGFGLSPLFSCGFELFNNSGPITMLSGMWTVPNLRNTPNSGLPNDFRTFFGLGFLDVHVEMTVDAANNITTEIRIHTGAEVAIPVRPGDTMSAVLCLQTNAAGTAFYGLANETTGQTMNLTMDTGFPPAVAINAGVSRGSQFNGPPDPLARFGVVYFDELVAYTPNGTRLLTNGTPTTMVDSAGKTLAIPQKLNDFAFKVVHQG
jgi:hypothetical protein